jgi:hypothetical protein
MTITLLARQKKHAVSDRIIERDDEGCRGILVNPSGSNKCHILLATRLNMVDPTHPLLIDIILQMHAFGKVALSYARIRVLYDCKRLPKNEAGNQHNNE